jgi:hypothetical protein
MHHAYLTSLVRVADGYCTMQNSSLVRLNKHRPCSDELTDRLDCGLANFVPARGEGCFLSSLAYGGCYWVEIKAKYRRHAVDSLYNSTLT